MERSLDAFEQFNQVGTGFLLTELETGLTFLSVAATTASKETAVRNRDNASVAYQSVLRYMDRIQLNGDDKANFDQKLAELRRGLIEAGYPV